jgi:quercetin dioxygenase-like cupin family protein
MPPPRRFVTAADAVQEANAWADMEWLCRPDVVAADKLLVVRVTMPPHHCHPFHTHPHREEVIYVISGRAEQWVDQAHQHLGPGETAHIPAGMVHATYNTTDEPLVFLAILSPAHLPDELASVEDPHDVSAEAPWNHLRDGLPVCVTRD